MLLHFDNVLVPMRLVYQLSEELKSDPQQIALAQKLTLDASRPEMGLKGTYGLFGSPQWWKSISDGEMPLKYISGVIKRVYVSGQDPSAEDNTFELLTSDGRVIAESCYVDDADDLRFFAKGHWVEIVYALDELKSQPAPNGGLNLSEIALEMAVSEVPVPQSV
jgi:hypothetical protein